MSYRYTDDQLEYHRSNTRCQAVKALIEQNKINNINPILKKIQALQEEMIQHQRKHKAIVKDFDYHESAAARTKYVNRCNRDVGPAPNDLVLETVNEFQAEKARKGY